MTISVHVCLSVICFAESSFCLWSGADNARFLGGIILWEIFPCFNYYYDVAKMCTEVYLM